MKQKAWMVLCVLFGAGVVMMCDSDAVQDMVDGEAAHAATSSELTGLMLGLTGATCPTDSVAIDAAYVGLHEALLLQCRHKTKGVLHGPSAWLVPHNGELEFAVLWRHEEGRLHGLNISRIPNEEGLPILTGGLCFDTGQALWTCSPSGEGLDNFILSGELRAGPDTPEGTPSYVCSTREEAEALAAEHGCP